MGDGTFAVVPALFSQLYTLHVSEDGNTIPCVFALTTNRREQTYKEIFQWLSRERPAYSPRLIITDFEQAAITTFGEAFPMAIQHGCFFSTLHRVYGEIKLIYNLVIIIRLLTNLHENMPIIFRCKLLVRNKI